MYVKKEDKEKIEKLDQYLKKIKFPDKWSKFVREEKNKEYIAKKNIKTHICTCFHCMEKFETTQKINEYVKCPHCKFKVQIKSDKLKNYNKKRDLILIQKYEEGYVLRIFELFIVHTSLNPNKMQFYLTEWGRKIIDKQFHEDQTYVSNNLKNNMGCLYVIHYEKTEQWKPYDRYYNFNFYGKYYYYNFKDLFYEMNPYSEIWTLAKKVDYLKFLPLAKDSLRYKFNSLELLTKAGLYNLANNCTDYEIGKFEKVFGVDKSYLPFMIKNDITSYELEILKKYKVKNIDFIRYMNNFSNWQLNDILKYCKPMDLYKYNLNPKRASEYLDYISFAKKLGFNITDKKYLYPKNLKRKHDEYMNQIEINKNKELAKKIKSRYKRLVRNAFEYGKFTIFAADSIESLENESSEQNNCVRTYAERYANKECDIYFMRLIDQKNKSLVTVEVKNSEIVQKRTKNNQQTTKEQDKFLDMWETKILKGSRNEKNKCSDVRW